MKKIGIICPLERELRPYINEITDVKITDYAKLKIYSGLIGKTEIVILCCGMCKVNAAIATQILIDKFNVDSIIVSGTAGGIDPTLKIGDTVISTQVAYHDVSDEVLTKFHPWLKENYFVADTRILDLFQEFCNEKEHVQHVFFGKIVTGEYFVDSEGRNEIIEKFNPLCVDMETASVAHVCYVQQIPFIAVRSISDTENHSGIEVFEQNCERAAINSFNIIFGIISSL